MDTKKFNILLVGEAGRGKSSLLNSLSCSIVSSTVTGYKSHVPEIFELNKSGTNENLISITNSLTRCGESISGDKKISKPIIKCLNETAIPIYNGLENTIICDFSSSENDDKCAFLEEVKNNIHNFDLVIYVTCPNYSPSCSEQIKKFEKIKNLVEYENKMGHYVELVIVVNKIDDLTDDDKIMFFNNIRKKFGYPSEKIFRYSCHKVLLNSIKKFKLALLFPKIMKKEANIILKNAGVLLNENLKNLEKNNYYITHYDIDFMEDIFDEKTNKDDFIIGDWDNLISFIKTCQINKTERATKTMYIYMALVINTFLSENSNDIKDVENLSSFDEYILTKTKHQNVGHLTNNKKITKLVEIFLVSLMKIKKRITNKFINITGFNQLLNDMIKCILNNHKKHNLLLLISLYYNFSDNILIGLDTLIDGLKDHPKVIMNIWYNNYKYIENDKVTNKMISLLSNKDAWSDDTFYKIYDTNDKKWYSISMNKPKYVDYDKSKIISNLINDEKSTTLIRLLRLAITPIKFFNYLENKDKIMNLLKSIDPNWYLYIESEIIDSDQFDNDPMCELFFRFRGKSPQLDSFVRYNEMNKF